MPILKVLFDSLFTAVLNKIFELFQRPSATVKEDAKPKLDKITEVTSADLISRYGSLVRVERDPLREINKAS